MTATTARVHATRWNDQAQSTHPSVLTPRTRSAPVRHPSSAPPRTMASTATPSTTAAKVLRPVGARTVSACRRARAAVGPDVAVRRGGVYRREALGLVVAVAVLTRGSIPPLRHAGTA